MADFNSSNTAAGNDYSQPDNQKRGTGFTNLQKYLTANNSIDPTTGQPAQSNLDQYVGNQISNEGQNFQQNLQGAQNDLSNQLNTVGPDLDKEKTEVDQVLTDPTKATDQQVSDFQGWLNPTTPQWTNPQSVVDVQNQARDLSSLGNQFQNGNVQGILQRYGGNGQYGQGQQNFDSMLLGNASGIRSGVQGLNNVNNQVNNAIGGATANLGQRIQQAQGNVNTALYGQDGTASNVNGGAFQNLNNAVSTGVTDINNKNTNAYNAALQAIQAGNFDPSLISKIQAANPGLAASNGGVKSYGLNLGDYLSSAPTATAADAATSDQIARANALSKLAGVTPGTGFSWATQTQNPAIQSYNPIGADMASRFSNDAASKQAQYQNAMNASAPGQIATTPNIVGGYWVKPGPLQDQEAQLQQMSQDPFWKPSLNEIMSALGNVQTKEREISDQYGAQTTIGGNANQAGGNTPTAPLYGGNSNPYHKTINIGQNAATSAQSANDQAWWNFHFNPNNQTIPTGTDPYASYSKR